MIRAHQAAVLARLREDAILATCTFDSTPQSRPERYCVVYTSNGPRSAERLMGPASTADFQFTVHCVGGTTAQAQLIAERVFAKLIDWTPTITGRKARRMRHIVSRPIAIDTDVTPNLWYSVDVFGLTTSPA